VPDCFDKLKQSAGKGVTTVSVISKEMLETSKLESQIASIQNQKKQGLEELGNIVYTMHLRNAFDEDRLRIKFSAIAVMDEQVEQREKELAEVHAKAQEALGKPKPIAVCSCGVELYGGARFCGGCGWVVEGLLHGGQPFRGYLKLGG